MFLYSKRFHSFLEHRWAERADSEVPFGVPGAQHLMLDHCSLAPIRPECGCMHRVFRSRFGHTLGGCGNGFPTVSSCAILVKV